MSADSKRITQADFDTLDNLLDTHCFSIPRIRFTESERQFVELMLAAQDLHIKNKKYPTVGEARAENQRKIEYREKLDRDYFESRWVEV